MDSERRMHKMKLNAEPFDAITSGAKTIELRLYDEKRRAIQVGDLIEFTRVGSFSAVEPAATDERAGATVGSRGAGYADGALRTVREVVALHVFGSFDELYCALPLKSCGYTADEVARGEARASDMRAYYSREDEARYGVVGIELAEYSGEIDN